MPDQDTNAPAPLRVVGIGASAGGLEALEQLFRAMPIDTGMAFVVVQHLSRDFKSQMDELLARWTRLDIKVATHEQPLAPNTIHLMPPDAELIVSQGRLLLSQRSEGLALPIDQFLRSCARDLAERTIAIILSGTGSDGSRGVREVHEAGGLVLAQTEDTAKFNGMPKSAIETGAVDYVLAPRDMPGAIRSHFASIKPGEPSSDDPAEAVKLGGMQAVFALLHERYGIDFSSYKPGTIGRRTERRLLLAQSDNLSDYIGRLRTDRAELDALYHDLLIGVTEFFRDGDAFKRLEQAVVPQLIDEAPTGKELRVWVAGCATGEEAYSLAMLLLETIERSGRALTAKIFATDVHRPSLDTASAGLYPERALAAIDPRRRARFFSSSEEGMVRVTPELRRMIVFAPHNVIRDAPFTKLDLVTCRNLLIYLQPSVQRKIMSLFHFGLRTGGVLFLGPSETPGDIGDEFELVDQHWKLYRKRRDVRLLPGLRSSPLLATHTSSPAPTRGGEGPLLEVFGSLLDSALPPSVLLGEQHEILHTFGDISALLRLPRGRPSLSLLDLIEGELKLAVAGALHRAARSRAPVSFTGVSAGSGALLDVRVTPIEVARISTLYFLVSLGGSTQVVPPRSEAGDLINLDAASHDRLESLEIELRHTKENLQATIEELEASNEELQATNEELLASNEELQSTNEELHSVNEELYTVNSEFQHKIDELTELSDDIDNLLLSTEVHTLFLDRQLCIRKFTPAMAEVFNLVESDVGRRIEGFVHTISIANLGEILVRTRDTGERYEAEVESRSGTAFLLRVLPYRQRNGGDEAERAGVVVTLVDITQLREAEHALREQIVQRDRFLAMLSHELRNPLAAIHNALTLVDRRLPAPDDALARPLALIERQTRHMQRLLDDLLDVSRVTQGKIQLRRETFDLREVVHDVVEQLGPALAEHRHALALTPGDAPLWLHADRARIVQVVENLLTNAIKYTQDGGHLALVLARRGASLELVVSDDGAGLEPSTMAHIFEMFVQADTTLDRSQGGLGVGLTLVHNLVELHGGTIEARSEGRKRGSTFIVRLPLVEAPTPASEPATLPTPATRGPVKLAVVEDRPEIRETLAELLRDDGYVVLTAGTGLDGLALIERERPDVGLLDIGLPGIDGYELARRLRTEHIPRIPLIAMTGYGRSEDRERVAAAGFDAHLIKPIDVSEVVVLLERLGYPPPAR